MFSLVAPDGDLPMGIQARLYRGGMKGYMRNGLGRDLGKTEENILHKEMVNLTTKAGVIYRRAVV